MTKRKSDSASVQTVRDLAKKALETKQSKYISELMEFCTDSEPPIVHAAISCLFQVFSKYLETGLLDKQDELAAALKDYRKKYLQLLASNLANPDLRIQVFIAN